MINTMNLVLSFQFYKMSIMFNISTILILTNFLIAISASVIQDDQLIIELLNPAGSTLKGHTLKTDKGVNYFAFEGIPYAEPPVGKNRFKNPIYSKGWNGILDATNNTKECLQIEFGDLSGTEDCLVINVYTPKNPKVRSELLPVLVFIHGGGFLVGSGGSNSPKFLMEEDIIVVNFNYRLGVLGFLSTEDEVIPGNFGLRDQQLAIEWTYNNIEAFGGDPEKITIAGGSAGAASVGWHLLNVNHRISKFFRGAILASGTALCIFGSRPNARSEAFKYGRALDNKLNSNKSEDLLEVLMNTTAEKLISAMDQEVIENPFLVVIDKDGKDFSRPQTDSMDHGVFVKVPMLIGFNSEEMMNMWGPLDDVKEMANRSTEDVLWTFGYRMKDKQRMHEMASLLQKRYTSGSFIDDLPAFIRFSSDMEFTAAIFRHVEDVNKYAPQVSPYLYRFSYKPSSSPENVLQGPLDDVKEMANRSTEDVLWTFGYRMKDKQRMHEMASLLQKRYTSGSFIDDLPAFIRFSSDMEFTAAIFRHVEDVNKYAPQVSPYLYRFSYKPSSSPENVLQDTPGVSHGMDLNLLFNFDEGELSKTDILISQRIVRIWSNFIKNQDPIPSPDPLFGNITWPASKTSKLLTYLDLNVNLTTMDNPRNYTYTRDILEEYLEKPITGF